MITTCWIEKLCNKSKFLNVKALSMTSEWFIAENILFFISVDFFEDQPVINLMMKDQTTLEISCLAKFPRAAKQRVHIKDSLYLCNLASEFLHKIW